MRLYIFTIGITACLSLVGTSLANSCQVYGFQTQWIDYVKCQEENEMEVSKEQDKSTGLWTITCCTDQKDWSDKDLYVEQCQEMDCVPPNKANSQCTDGITKNLYYKGHLITYVQAATNECTQPNGQPGVQVLCCPSNSTDTLFATLYGAENNEFPHYVRVGYYGCGGTVYNDQWILTAAHCVTTHDTGRLISVAADGQKEWDNCCGQVRINVEIRDAKTPNTYNVTDIIVHPNSSYLVTKDQRGSYTSNFDVALMKVDRKIKFSDNVKALRIPDSSYDPLKYGDRAIILGFGTTDTGRQSLKMLKSNVKIWPNNEVHYYFPQTVLDQLMWVGGIHNGETFSGVGQGDSGGPAVCRGSSGTAVLCGVTSFTPVTGDCKQSLSDDACAPSAYTAPGYVAKWIKEIAGDQDGVQFYDQPVFGQAVGRKEYPSHAHITGPDGTRCGGTLVSDDIVLTAATCVVDASTGQPKQGTQVTFGVKELTAGGGDMIAVDKVAIAPGFSLARAKRSATEHQRKKRVIGWPYEKWSRGMLEKNKLMKESYHPHNLAFVKLKKPAGKKVARLATKSPKDGDLASEVAYPYKSLGTDSNGTIPLSKRQFTMLNRDVCQTRLDRLSIVGVNVKLEDDVMCGVEKYSGGSMCDRELGGGLYCKEKGKEVLCGVQVFRMCEFNIPNAFYDVGAMSDWLKSTLNSLK